MKMNPENEQNDRAKCPRSFLVGQARNFWNAWPALLAIVPSGTPFFFAFFPTLFISFWASLSLVEICSPDPRTTGLQQLVSSVVFAAAPLRRYQTVLSGALALRLCWQRGGDRLGGNLFVSLHVFADLIGRLFVAFHHQSPPNSKTINLHFHKKVTGFSVSLTLRIVPYGPKRPWMELWTSGSYAGQKMLITLIPHSCWEEEWL